MKKHEQIIQLEKDLGFEIEESQYKVEERKLVRLDIESKSIRTLDSFEDLINLEILNLSFNKIERVEPLAKLKNLKKLYLSGNQIKRIGVIGDLQKLYTLFLSFNQIDSIDSLANMKKLRTLFCRGNNISQIDPLAKFARLNSIFLSNNQITTLEKFPKFDNLLSLDLAGNRIMIIDDLSKFTKIVDLYLGNNEIEELEPLTFLKKVKLLDLSNNKICKIEPLLELKELKSLYLGNNQIEHIKSIGKLKKLERIDLANNKITRLVANKNLPTFRYKKNTWEIEDQYINFYNNPLPEDAISAIKAGPNALKAYFANKAQGMLPVNEAKLMILGEGEAGKTNLCNFLLKKPFENKSSSTIGIALDQWKMQEQNTEYRINLWDVGGQWVQQQVHKFFITPEAVYVIVLNARKDEKPNRWLEWIKTYAPDSNVIIVANQMDTNPSYQFSENSIRQEYPFVKAFHKISLIQADAGNTEEYEKVLDLEKTIKAFLLELKSIKTEVPANYQKFKHAMEEEYLKNRSHISTDLFEAYMQKFEIIGERDPFIKYLNNLGVIRHFENENRYVLNPEWLSDGVYRILTSAKLAQTKGVISCADFEEILSSNTDDGFEYKNKEDFRFIRELMEHFQLAYFDKEHTCYVPQSFDADLPKGLKVAELFERDAIQYHFHFPAFFPDTLICRFITEHFPDLGLYYWQEGIHLKKVNEGSQEVLAEAVVQNRKNRIELYVKGENKQLFFNQLRQSLRDLLKDTKIPYDEKVIDSKLGIAIKYEDVLVRLRKKRTTMEVVHGNEVEDIDLRQLLGHIQKERTTESETLTANTINHFHGNVQINMGEKISIYQALPNYDQVLTNLEAIASELPQNETVEITEVIKDLETLKDNPKEAKSVLAKAKEKMKKFKDAVAKEGGKEIIKKSAGKAFEQIKSWAENIDWSQVGDNWDRITSML